MSDSPGFLGFVTEGFLRQNTSPESLRRRHEYFEDGAVVSLIRRGRSLEAEVEGSQPEPYRVRIVADAGGITDADCDCPYDWGGWCKHIVAALLAGIDNPESVEERPTVEDLLAGLDRDQLLRLLLHLAEDDGSLVDEMERYLALPQAGDSGAAPVRHTPVRVADIRRQVRSLLHSLDRMSSSDRSTPPQALPETAVGGPAERLARARRRRSARCCSSGATAATN